MTSSTPFADLRPQVPGVDLATLLDVAHAFGAGELVGAGDTQVQGITHDSRAVARGEAFVAVPGERFDGADYLGDAARAGASAAIVTASGRERLLASGLPGLVVDDVRQLLGLLAATVYGHPSNALTVIGITGTNGKTTTASMIANIARAAGKAVGLIGTVETRIGDEVVPSVRTTPEATDVHALLAVMRERGVEVVAMEVSSHALVLGRVDAVHFDVVAFTNLSQDHLDFHKTMEDYFAAKASLFVPGRADRAVVCIDDDWGKRLAAQTTLPTTTVTTLGLDADWDADLNAAGDPNLFVRLFSPRGSSAPAHNGHDAGVFVDGAVNAQNAVVAAATAVSAGFVPDRDPIVGDVALEQGISGTRVPGRMEQALDVRSGDHALCAYVDYAHTPDAIDAVLRGSASERGRQIVVVGAGGDRDPGKRAGMGAAAAAHARLVIVTDDNPRSEDPAAIRAEVLRGARDAARTTGAEVVEIADRAEAIAHGVAQGWAERDLLMVLGKGHEQGQEIAGEVHPFDDRTQVRTAFEALTSRMLIPLDHVVDVVNQGRDHGQAPRGDMWGVVRIDSRDVEPGDLFVAVQGGNVDGHDYLSQAGERGAVAAVVSREVSEGVMLRTIQVPDTLAALTALARDHTRRLPESCLRIGITGSSGKTTTKDLLAQVLETHGPTIAPPGSFNNEIGLPLTVLRATPATSYLVLEMGARGIGHIAHLMDIAAPRIGVALNVGSAHIGEFGGPDAIAQAKGEIVEGLPEGGVAVLNGDDPRTRAMASRTRARVVLVGESEDCDVRGTDIVVGDDACVRLLLHADGALAQVALAFPGRHMVGNALAAAAVALEAGMSIDEVAAGLTSARPRSRWRMETTRRDDGLLVVNDAYNANPESVLAALSSVAVMPRSGRLWAVLGEMRELGDRAESDHERVGAAAAEAGVAQLIAVGPPIVTAALIRGARSAAPTIETTAVATAPEALAAVGGLRHDDVVLIKGSRAVGLEIVADALLGSPHTSELAQDLDTS